MLRITEPVRVESPKTIEDAIALLKANEGARIIAGGTDLLPNLKHGLYDTSVLINLKAVSGLDTIELDGPTIRLGALVPIHRLATDPAVAGILPSLAVAAGQIAGPQHRRMGTLGGNVCLDTRCVYINQTHFWRESLGYCLKKDGDRCHVVTVGKKCVAAASNDTAPVLLSLGASVELAGPDGIRTLPLEKFYVNDGIRNIGLAPDEILVAITVPKPAPDRRMAFQKLRIRDAIDYPMLNMGLSFTVDATGILSRPDLFISAIAARPRRIKGMPEGPLNDALIDTACALAYRRVRPLTNINADTDWRRDMVPVLLRRAFQAAMVSSEP